MLWASFLLAAGCTAAGFEDPRYIRNGNKMMVAGYTDQPYCAVKNNRNSGVTGGSLWLCVITASVHGEGSSGEQVYSVHSEDQGKILAITHTFQSLSTTTQTTQQLQRPPDLLHIVYELDNVLRERVHSQDARSLMEGQCIV